MRISTNTLYQSAISQISQMQSNQVKLQAQIASGKRIVNPSDDPVASARIHNIEQAQNINEQYATNRSNTTSELSAQENVLSSVTELLINTKTSLVAAGNQSYSDAERSFMANDITNSLDQLLSFANTRDSNGNYVFSGNQSNTPAFTKTATGASYNGDTSQRLIQVASDRQLAVNNSGDTVFQPSGQDIFKALTDLVNLLKTPVTNDAGRAALTSGIATISTSVESALDSVLNVRASTGSKLKELDTLNAAGSDRAIQYAQNLSDLQDLDYAKALSQVSQQKVILEAAQQAFVKTSGLSLFTYM